MKVGSAGVQQTVLYVVDGLGISGKTKALVDLAIGLDPRRYRAEVCCFDEESSPLVTRLRAANVPVYEVPCRDGLNIGVVARLFQLMRTVRPQVVHCYNPRAMLYAGLAARAQGIHATLGTLSAFACHVPDRDYEFLPQRLFTTSRKNRLRNQVVAQLMRNVVAVSERLGERFCQYNGVPLHRLAVVSYGADIETIWRRDPAAAQALRQRIGARPGDLLLGSVGRLVEQKDYPTQLTALALALRRAPHLRMVIAGAGPLSEPLIALSQSLGIADRVHFLGHFTDVPLLLRALDVFVLASKFEPYGVALLEAKGAGLPIVATEVNEIPEILSGGESGLLVKRGEPAELATTFCRLAADADLRQRLGRQALSEARTRHSLEAMIAGYQARYDTLLNIPPARTSDRAAHLVARQSGATATEA